MTDQLDKALQSAVGRIQHGLHRLEDRGRLKEDVDTIMGRIETTLQLPEFAGLDVVIPYHVAAGRSP